MKIKMRSIKLISSSHPRGLTRDFTRFANQRFNEINQEIVDFNAADSQEARLVILKRIDALRRYLQDTRPQDIVEHEFDEIMRKLFNACQKQFKTLGLAMHELQVETESTELSTKPFTVLLANIDPEFVNEIHQALMRKPLKDAWCALINKHPEHAHILNQYDIICYRGIDKGNAQNFKLTSLDLNNPHELILRIDNRLGGARELDTYFRTTELKEIFTPIASPRTATLENGHTTTLLITSVCPGGNALTGTKYHKNEAERVHGALDVYQKMAEILLTIQEEGGLFPDAKNSNWLVDELGDLRIADTKSIICSYQKTDHDFNKTYLKNRWAYGSEQQLMISEDFFPWEINDRPASFDIDRLHSYILGVNINEYLTAEDASGTKLQFISFEGRKLKDMVQQLALFGTMQLFTAMVEIKSLKMLHHCNELIDQLEQSAAPYLNETIGKLRQEVFTTATDDERRFALTKKIIIISKFHQLYQELMFYNLKEGMYVNEEVIENSYQELIHSNEKNQYVILKQMMDSVRYVKEDITCNRLLGALRSSTLDPTKDTLMTQEIEQFDHEMKTTRDPDERKILETKLKHLIQENRKMASFVSHLLKEESRRSPINAQILEEAYYRVPPAERGKIMDTKYKSPAMNEIRNALGTSKAPVIGCLIKPIDPNNNSKFNEYKRQYAAIQTSSYTNKEEEDEIRKRIQV
jgi:hypothetical protein